MHEYQIDLKKMPEGKYDAIIVAVAHHEYREYLEPDFLKLANETCLIVDIKGLYTNKIEKLEYWSL